MPPRLPPLATTPNQAHRLQLLILHGRCSIRPTAPPRPSRPSRPQSTQSSRPTSDQPFDSLVQPPAPASTSASGPAHATSSAPPSPQIVFGSRLAGPAARPRYDVVDGRAPPRPAEPDNCCMSGCVNCVWDRYREELEAWAAAKATAEALAARKAKRRAPTPGGAGTVAAAAGGASMDDDGGGSEALWSDADVGREGRRVADCLLGELPVGIREFMLQEKRIRERKRARRRQAEGERDGDVA